MNRIYHGFFTLVLLLAVSACESFVDGFEEDPNNASDAPIEAVLNGAFTGLIVAHSGEDARLSGLWARQFTGSDRQYSAFNVYNINAENFEWDKYYLAVENAQITLDKAEETGNLLASGIAKIVEAHSIGMVTSLWGDIPYSEANRFPDIQDPVFDSQTDVYAQLQARLDEAIADLSGDPASAEIEAVDFYFGGDGEAWTRVAYTLKARFYLHVKDYGAALDAARNGVLAPADNWMIPHNGGGYNQDMNMYHSFVEVDRVGYMDANNAILPAWLDPATDAYRGNAKTDEAARFAYLYTGAFPAYDLNTAEGGMWGATASFPLVTALETQLIIAETVWRVQSDPAVALEALNEARAMLAEAYPEGTYAPYTLADFEPDALAGIPGMTAAEALLYEILEEKYASLVGQIEVFNDLRRTGNLLGIPPVTGSEIPCRFLIPQVEIDANTMAPSPIPGLFEPTPVNRP